LIVTRLIKGAASKTTGTITTQAISQDLNQNANRGTSCHRGAIAIPAATAHVNPDWMTPNKKWPYRFGNFGIGEPLRVRA
jgi:hypothetical protein